jgi:hypothetical protein
LEKGENLRYGGGTTMGIWRRKKDEAGFLFRM